MKAIPIAVALMLIATGARAGTTVSGAAVQVEAGFSACDEPPPATAESAREPRPHSASQGSEDGCGSSRYRGHDDGILDDSLRGLGDAPPPVDLDPGQDLDHPGATGR